MLHGIWLRAFTLGRLRRTLEREGFDVSPFDYASVFDTPEHAVDRLVRRLEKIRDDRPTHLVGHSLGGLVAIKAALAHPELVDGRIVCLGSPLAGSRTATVLARRRATRWITGRSTALLLDGLGDCERCAPVGVIAGSLPLGFGRFVPGLETPHDGTVALNETRIAGLADHIELPTTHSGLLLSDEAARQTCEFLRHGRFSR